MRSGPDFCKAILNLVNEVDTFTEALEKDKAKVRGIFRGGKGKGKADIGMNDMSITPIGASGEAMLLWPNLVSSLTSIRCR